MNISFKQQILARYCIESKIEDKINKLLTKYLEYSDQLYETVQYDHSGRIIFNSKIKPLKTWATRYFKQANDLLKTSGYDDATALKYIQDFCEKYHSKS